jgi:hypothetical protein
VRQARREQQELVPFRRLEWKLMLLLLLLLLLELELLLELPLAKVAQ